VKFDDLIEIVADEPVFETGVLLAGAVDPADARRQLSRWVKAGRLWQFRRGLYALAAPFQKVAPHPFVIANRLLTGSYVSCQSALAHYGLIPESAPLTISVSVHRHRRWDTPAGSFEFHVLKRELMFGYQLVALGQGQSAFVARPEKALLDLIYLTPGADSRAWLAELRLQHVEQLDLTALQQMAGRSAKPRLIRAAALVAAVVQSEAAAYEAL